MQEIIIRAKYYNFHRTEKFIKLVRELITKYRSIAEAENITKEYNVYIGPGSCPICELAHIFQKHSCLACPIWIVTNKMCVEHKSYEDLTIVSTQSTKRHLKIRFLNNRISFQLHILNKLLELRKYYYEEKQRNK